MEVGNPAQQDKRPRDDAVAADNEHDDKRQARGSKRTTTNANERSDAAGSGHAPADSSGATGETSRPPTSRGEGVNASLQSSGIGGSDSRIHENIHRMNSKVYAARVTGAEDGLFTRRAIRRGEILCQYTGADVPVGGDDPTDAQYLMHMLRRKRPNEDEEMVVTIDGRGELGGYANYADRRVANAIVADVIRTVQARGDSAGDRLETAMVVIAAEDIPAGREVRWDYDHKSGRPFRRAMLARGVPAEALDSRDYATVVWTIADGVMEAGTVQRDADFPYATLEELGLCAKVERARVVVREANTRGRKRERGEPRALTRRTEATDAPT